MLLFGMCQASGEQGVTAQAIDDCLQAVHITAQLVGSLRRDAGACDIQVGRDICQSPKRSLKTLDTAASKLARTRQAVKPAHLIARGGIAKLASGLRCNCWDRTRESQK